MQNQDYCVAMRIIRASKHNPMGMYNRLLVIKGITFMGMFLEDFGQQDRKAVLSLAFDKRNNL